MHKLRITYLESGVTADVLHYNRPVEKYRNDLTISYLPYRSDFLTKIGDLSHLLVIVAMDSEETAMVANLKTESVSYGRRTKVTVKHLNLPKCKVSIAKSGVGLVNAGLLLSIVAEHQSVESVVLLGVGGALDPKLNTGDTVVAKQIIQHDSMASTAKGNVLIAPGALTLSAGADAQVDPVMRCDSVLVEWITSSIGSTHRGKIFQGTLLSGSEFVGDIERKRLLCTITEDVLMVDMEAAAVAQVARQLQIPMVAAKTVADRAEPDTTISKDYRNFLEAAAIHSAGVLQGLLKSFG